MFSGDVGGALKLCFQRPLCLRNLWFASSRKLMKACSELYDKLYQPSHFSRTEKPSLLQSFRTNDNVITLGI